MITKTDIGHLMNGKSIFGQKLPGLYDAVWI